ncbi:uroporphyrinogen decarboxylase family protein [Limnochorda pilosa]|uniref:Uroporphyrinogen decarboxylase (URO-D) domain-containing protein n=1 Tax=Limnochorda pilosa TaxID=1555112 RepID=A0A0K2SHJ8_LIMPI|nr:uroporphyrinogen decarboxylase family protein [Limnochorda pilosa]BAS26583.1 hypothetical protein LIP_0726 [Limnochorda pilosa]
MNGRDRVLAAVEGRPVDRPPFSVWYHFASQHRPPANLAEQELAFFDVYRPDLLKVMNDYRPPLPGGIQEVRRPEEWAALEPLTPEAPTFRSQIEALRIIREAVGHRAVIVDTVFSPWATAGRMLGEQGLERLRQAPEALRQGLAALAESLARYVGALLEEGIDGIFFATRGASTAELTGDDFERLVRPYDLQVLEAARPARLNVLHVHGTELDIHRVLDYPAHVVNWSHHHTPPTLAEARSLTDRCLMGGIDEQAIGSLTPPEVARQVRAALEEAGRERFIVGPGCAVPTETPPDRLLAAREAADWAR